MDKLKVCRGETPNSWLPVDMEVDTDTVSEEEPEDGENQDDGVVDDQPNELDYELIVNQTLNLQTEMVTTTAGTSCWEYRQRPSRRRGRSDVITIDASATTPSLFARICSHRPRFRKSNAVGDRLCWMV